MISWVFQVFCFAFCDDCFYFINCKVKFCVSNATAVDFCTSQSLKDTIRSTSHDISHDNWNPVIDLLFEPNQVQCSYLLLLVDFMIRVSDRDPIVRRLFYFGPSSLVTMQLREVLLLLPCACKALPKCWLSVLDGVRLSCWVYTYILIVILLTYIFILYTLWRHNCYIYGCLIQEDNK